MPLNIRTAPSVALACAMAVLSGPTSFAQSSISDALERQSRLPRSGASDPKGIDLGAIRVRLWYEETGRLSENIAPPADFHTWNTIIGEGQAQEIANDVLMTVEILSGAKAENIDIPLTLEVRDATGKILAIRQVSRILTSETGNAQKGIWVYDVGCAGLLTFSATLGRLTRSVQVDFPCGE